MTTDPFNSPAKGGKFNAETHNGKLLLITPTSYEEGIETTFGTKDAVKANVVVIDEANPSASEKIDDALLFGGVMIGQTKTSSVRVWSSAGSARARRRRGRMLRGSSPTRQRRRRRSRGRTSPRPPPPCRAHQSPGWAIGEALAHPGHQSRPLARSSR